MTVSLFVTRIPYWPATREALSLSLWLLVGMAAGYVALVLWFGMLNHRSVERSVVRVWPQVVWIFVNSLHTRNF